MTKKALLMTGQESETISMLARNLIPIAGQSLFVRQMQQMQAIGVEEMHVVTDWFVQDFEKEIALCSVRPEKIFLYGTKDAPLKLLEHNNEGNIWFLLEEGVVLDQRIIRYIANHPSSTVLSFIGYNEFLAANTANAMPLHLEKDEGYFGAIAKLSSNTLAATVRKLNGLESLPNALKAIARSPDCSLVRLVDIPLYKADHHRKVDLVWFPVTRRTDTDRATALLLEQAQKAGQGWVAAYIHRPVENILIKYMVKTPIGPRPLMVVNLLLGLVVLYFFRTGPTLPALAGGLGLSALISTASKLASIQKRALWPGGTTGDLIGRVLIAVVLYGWFVGLAVQLAETHFMVSYLLVLMLILFGLADKIQHEFFRRMTRLTLYDCGGFDRKFSLVAGQPYTLLWALLPFGLFGQWNAGFAFMAFYGIVTFFIHQVRLIYHLKEFMIGQSPVFAENFEKTKMLKK